MSKAREQIAKLDDHQVMAHACTGCCRSYEYWCERLLDAIEEAQEFIGTMCSGQDGRVDGLQHCRCVYALRRMLERALEGNDERV
jgi:hypothetical protein